MQTFKVSLKSVDAVKEFVNLVARFDYDFDLVSGRYTIDAKSIMGIFSLDLSKVLTLNVYSDDPAIERVLRPYIIH